MGQRARRFLTAGSAAAHHEIEGGPQQIEFDRRGAAQFADGLEYAARRLYFFPGRIEGRELREMDAYSPVRTCHPFLETFSQLQFSGSEIVFREQRFQYLFGVVPLCATNARRGVEVERAMLQ